MSDEVWIVATAATAFGRHVDRGFRALAAEVVGGLRAGLGGVELPEIDGAWFGNCAMGHWGQHNIRGQTVLSPLQRAGALPDRLPVVNVEAGCATGSAAFHGAVMAVAGGGARFALALGVEKTIIPDDPAGTFAVFAGGIDQRHPDEWSAHFAAEAAAAGLGWAPDPRRVLFLDVHALQARRHMARWGTTAAQLAAIASKSHRAGARNAGAQQRRPLSPGEVLADKPVVEPFTRSMCCPLSDGAAGALLCSGEALRGLPAELRARALRVRGSVLEGGAWRGLDGQPVVEAAAARLWARTGAGPAQVQIAEVHDATAWCELAATEALGLCGPGEGGPWAEAGHSAWDGSTPINPSGGLLSRGHPLGATGLGQLHELCQQLRGEAGGHQVPGEKAVGLQHNAGGLIGLDEALCHLALIERTA
jgi:acetyl-CoA acetyltransferase